MKYNRPHATAKWGTMAADWEAGVDFPRLIRDRFQKAQASIKAKGLGAVLAFNFDNIRYITGTHIGEWCRDKMNRYAICPREGGAFLFDPAVPAKRISSPWMEDRMESPISTMLGALPPAMKVEEDFAKQVKRVLTGNGRASKRQKDLADIMRLVETHPHLIALLPAPLREQIRQVLPTISSGRMSKCVSG